MSIEDRVNSIMRLANKAALQADHDAPSEYQFTPKNLSELDALRLRLDVQEDAMMELQERVEILSRQVVENEQASRLLVCSEESKRFAAVPAFIAFLASAGFTLAIVLASRGL